MAKIALSHDMFWRAGVMLKEHQADFRNAAYTHEQAATRLSAICGFPISVSIIPQLQETTGVSWVLKAKPKTRVSAVRKKSNKVIVESLHELWTKLADLVGEPPAKLTKLVQDFQEIKLHQERA